ncbi:hypothetical protein DE146DRAFT_657407 [Phaeosphaeria sp. MPI-PUGE-AT-0046c]|nr:hypothetical protein DE146DRAFT_657407 [Phaeosphaeria sp. MPI-PUGE-AT-0046c]
MTPRTRQSNKDQSSKVYYSKKVPQQVFFPHRRKTVRRPDPVAKDGTRAEQQKSLSGRMQMKRFNTICDSEEEDDENLEAGGVRIKTEVNHEADNEQHMKVQARGKKRRSDVLDEDNDNDARPADPAPKRIRRGAAAPNSNRRTKHVKVESEDEDTTPAPPRKDMPSSRSLRRQSTMTQLAEGRRPESDTEEPIYIPVKRALRRSWGGRSNKAKDAKQRTLTQMVPGMRLSGVVSDDELEELSDVDEELSDVDVEAETRDSQAYDEAIAARLAREGLMQRQGESTEETWDVDMGRGEELSLGDGAQNMEESVDQSTELPSLVVQSVEVKDEDTDEDTYHPTQFIDAPITRPRRNLRRTPAAKQQTLSVKKESPIAQRSIRKSKFGLLSTPEKRRIREIPSSQSPAESPLSARSTRSKIHRTPLKECAGNQAHAQETPSKRKQVTFQVPAKQVVAPPSLRKFRSTIQDSEDEEEDDVIEKNEVDHEHPIGENTQALINRIDNAADSGAVGAETQAMLAQIDEACADGSEGNDENDTAMWRTRDSSEGLDIEAPRFDQHNQSPDLGGRLVELYDRPIKSPAKDSTSYITNLEAKQEPMSNSDVPPDGEAEPATGVDACLARQEEPSTTDIDLSIASGEVPSSPPIMQQVVEDTCPSTPMVIMDSSDEEDEDEPNPTPPPRSTPHVAKSPATVPEQSADLDESIQVPQSPLTQRETQESHTSKAEQQLHNEWFSYSQYVNARPLQSSSMHVYHDKFSYDATPRPPLPSVRGQPSGHYTSQATTVDEVTPKKNRMQGMASANTTPHKIASSQPVSSPSKPPPLFIPSSFPSPTKVRMEDWSSPIFGNTQATYGVGASLEDFSIPPPPPDEEDWTDG